MAEGHKQRVILESEGHLEAKSNEADAKYKTVFREAEARCVISSILHTIPSGLQIYIHSKQQALMEASALAQQVEEIGRALSKSKDVIDPEARKLALEKLIELRRLEQLKAIAESRNNSTYFFGDRCELSLFSVRFSHISFTAALGQDPYNIDYAEQIKGGLHGRDGKGRPAQSDPASAAMTTL